MSKTTDKFLEAKTTVKVAIIAVFILFIIIGFFTVLKNISSSITLTILSIFVAIWLTLVTILATHTLCQEESKNCILRYLEPKIGKRAHFRGLYIKILRKVLIWLDQWFGKSLLGRKSFGRCFQMSAFYCVMFFLLGWSLGATGTWGGIQFLPSDDLSSYRISICIGVLTIFAIFVYSLLSAKTVPSVYRNPPITIVFVALITIIFATAGATIVSFNEDSVNIIVALTVVVALASVIAFSLASIIAAAVASIVVVALAALSDCIDTDNTVAFILFVAILPITNAFFDFISWAISRKIARWLENHCRNPHAFLYIQCLSLVLFDLLLALILLAGLAAFIPFFIKGYNTIFTAHININDYIQISKKSPWRNGLWITLMLLSTLFPTFLHLLIAALGAFLSMPIVGRQRVVSILHKSPPMRIQLLIASILGTTGISFNFVVFFFGAVGMTSIVYEICGNSNFIPNSLAYVATWSSTLLN